MQSSKLILKKLGGLFQASLLSSKPVSLLAQTQSLNVSSIYMRPINAFSFSTTSRSTLAETSEAFDYEELKNISQNSQLDRDLVLEALDKYYDYYRDETAAGRTVQTAPEIKEFTAYLLKNLSAFTDPSEVSQIVSFIVGHNGDNQEVLDSVKTYITRSNQLQSMSSLDLAQVFIKIFGGDKPFSADILDKFSSYLNSNRNTLDREEYAALVACQGKIQEILSSTVDSIQLAKHSAPEKAYLSQNIDALGPSGTVALYALLAQEEQPDEALVTRLEDKVIGNLEALNAEQLTSLVSSLHQMERDLPEMWTLVEEEIIAKIKQFTPHSLVQILGCFTSHDLGSDELYMQIDRGIGFNVKSVNVHELCMVVHAFAASGKYRKKFFFNAEEHIIQALPRLSASEVISVLWAYTESNTLNGAFYEAVEERLIGNTEEVLPQDWILLLDALVQLDENGTRLASSLAPKLVQVLGDKNNHEEFDEILAQKIYVLRTKNREVFNEVLPLLDTFLIQKLNENGQQDLEVLIQLGASLGENFDHVAQNKRLLQAYIKRLEQAHQEAKDSASEQQVEEIEFLLENLKGLGAMVA